MLETPRNKATPIAAQITFKPSWDGEAELTADLDWRQTGEQSWNIDVETADGLQLAAAQGRHGALCRRQADHGGAIRGI